MAYNNLSSRGFFGDWEVRSVSSKGKMIFVVILLLAIGGIFFLKQDREPDSLDDGEQPVARTLPVFLDIITPT